MNRIPNKNEVDYVLFHLSCHLENFDKIVKYFAFTEGNNSNSDKKIIFRLSDKKLDYSSIKYIENIPILFPLSQQDSIFQLINDCVVFNDDLLKSAFFLLSGYQEINLDTQKDDWGRFPYSESIQKKLNIIKTPVVNYYFRWIIRGIETFINQNNLNPLKIRDKEKFTFFLSHDVDRIQYFNKHLFKGKLKKLLKHFSKSELSSFGKYLKNFITYLPGNDPYWNFDTLLDIENERNIHSSYFFLHQDVPHLDSYYSFSDKNISELIIRLKTKGMEIGLHGSTRSYDNPDLYRKHKHLLETITGNDCMGVRQHRLINQYPKTARLQKEAGFIYDASLGFAECAGFRNSYCHPFKPFDHKNQNMLDIWEIPLIIMEATLFEHQNLSYREADKLIFEILGEIQKFSGVFSLLWHNSYLNEMEHPGINDFYIKLLDKILSFQPVTATGDEIIRNRINVRQN